MTARGGIYDDHYGDGQPVEVHDSCGCVFCDVGLEPERRFGRLMHHRDRCDDWVPCTRQRTKDEILLDMYRSMRR